jgi:hypothetical protein
MGLCGEMMHQHVTHYKAPTQSNTRYHTAYVVLAGSENVQITTYACRNNRPGRDSSGDSEIQVKRLTFIQINPLVLTVTEVE